MGGRWEALRHPQTTLYSTWQTLANGGRAGNRVWVAMDPANHLTVMLGVCIRFVSARPYKVVFGVTEAVYGTVAAYPALTGQAV